jgi:recombination protein RecA
MDIRRIGSIKDGDQMIGNRTRVKVVKNKVAAPFRMAEFEIIYGTGISRAGELLDMGEAAGIVSRSGSWYSYGDDRLGQGRENSRKFLDENSDVAEAIEEKLRIELGLTEAEVTGEEPPAEEKEDAEPAKAKAS